MSSRSCARPSGLARSSISARFCCRSVTCKILARLASAAMIHVVVIPGRVSRFLAEETRMNRILTSAAIGALAMYFLDPQAGRRRRARTRDKMEHARRRLRNAYEVTARDARHRAQGLQAMSRRLLQRGAAADDETLVGRVRAVLGRYVSHPHAIEVSAAGGQATLSGPILAAEAPALLGAVKRVTGVRGVENRLAVHQEPGNVSSLQGGVPRRGQRFELMQDNWSPSARVLVGTM